MPKRVSWSIERLEKIALLAFASFDIDTRDAKCTLLSGGLMNCTLRVQSSAGDYCVRLRPDELGPTSQLFAAERLALPHILRAGLACARLLGTISMEMEQCWLAAIFETVDGTRLDLVLSDGTEEEKFACARMLGRDLASLHAIPSEGFGTLESVDSVDCSTFLGRLLSAELEPLARIHPSIARLFERRIHSVVRNYQGSTRRPCVVHGDVHGRNIIRYGDRLVWLDWEACRYRLPEFDFAQLPFMMWRHDSRIEEEVIRSYCLGYEHSFRLDAELLHLVQIYWHIRFGLFLQNCKVDVDSTYFGTFSEHLVRATSLLEASPEHWALCLESGTSLL